MNVTLNIDGVAFNNNSPQNAVDIQPLAQTGTLGGSTQNSSFDTNAGGVIISMQNGSGGTYNVIGNEFNRTALQSILYAAANPTSGTLFGSVQGNTIGTSGQSGSACFPTTGSNCTGIDVNFIGGTGGLILRIGGTLAGQPNAIQQFDGNAVRIVANGSGSPVMHATVQNNVISSPLGAAAQGIQTNIGTTSGANVQGDFDVTGNNITGTYWDPGVGTQLGIHARVRFSSAHRLPGMSGSGTASAQTFLDSNNGGDAAKVFVEGNGSPGYTSGSACSTPP